MLSMSSPAISAYQHIHHTWIHKYRIFSLRAVTFLGQNAFACKYPDLIEWSFYIIMFDHIMMGWKIWVTLAHDLPYKDFSFFVVILLQRTITWCASCCPPPWWRFRTMPSFTARASKRWSFPRKRPSEPFHNPITLYHNYQPIHTYTLRSVSVKTFDSITLLLCSVSLRTVTILGQWAFYCKYPDLIERRLYVIPSCEVFYCTGYSALYLWQNEQY